MDSLAGTVDRIAQALGLLAVSGILLVPPLGLGVVGLALARGDVSLDRPLGPHIGWIFAAELLALLALLASVGLSSWADRLRAS